MSMVPRASLKLSRKLQPMVMYLKTPRPMAMGAISSANAPMARQSVLPRRRPGGLGPAGRTAVAARPLVTVSDTSGQLLVELGLALHRDLVHERLGVATALGDLHDGLPEEGPHLVVPPVGEGPAGVGQDVGGVLLGAGGELGGLRRDALARRDVEAVADAPVLLQVDLLDPEPVDVLLG